MKKRKNIKKTLPNYLEQNLSALAKKNQTYSEEIRSAKEKWMEPCRSQDGAYNFFVESAGKKILAYDNGSPTRAIKKEISNIEFNRGDVTVVVGAGAGHLIKEILKKKKSKHILIVIEPILAVARYALTIHGYQRHILNGSFFFVTDSRAAKELLNYFESSMIVQNWLALVDQYTLYRPNEYNEISNDIGGMVNRFRCNTGTTVSAGLKMAINDISNLPFCIRHRGVRELFGIFKNKPAVIVSTGPSLKKNIHRLIDAKNNVVIIAVAQALRPLLAYGITPDLICTVDYTVINMGHFRGLLDVDVPLVALNRTYAPLLKSWNGHKFICATPYPGFELKSVGILQEKGWVPQGGSVSHMCFGLAVSMGCNPIIIIGQDLAFGNDMISHFNLVDETGGVNLENGALTLEVLDQRSKLFDEKKVVVGPPVTLPGYFGNTVLTSHALASFFSQFEELFKKFKNKIIINATQGGANIKGSKKMTLKKALDLYCKEEVDKSPVKNLLSLADNGDELIEKILSLLPREIKELKVIVKNCEKGMKYSESLKNTNDLEFEKNLKANYKRSTFTERLAKKNPLLTVAILESRREISKPEYIDAAKQKMTKDELTKRIIANKRILEAAKKAANELIPVYENVEALLKKYVETKDENLLWPKVDETPNILDAWEDLERGNFARPYLESGKIISRLISENVQLDESSLFIRRVCEDLRCDAIREAKEREKQIDEDDLLQYNRLIKISRVQAKKKNFKRALKLVNEAVKLFPDRFDARWGRATCLGDIDKNQSFKEYIKLIFDFFDNPDIVALCEFEIGLVYIHNDEIQNGLLYIRAAMEKTERFDHFFEQLGHIYRLAKEWKLAISAYTQYEKKFRITQETALYMAECFEKVDDLKRKLKYKRKAARLAV